MLFVLLARSLLAGLTVSVPAEGSVRGVEIELGELCVLSGADPDLVARAHGLTLGFAPAPGFSRVLTQDRIQDELARALPGHLILLTGERTCRATTEVEELAPATLEAAAKLELGRAFEGVDASFTLAEAIAPIQVPRGHGPASLRTRVSPGKRVSGSIGVTIEVLVDGRSYRTAWTTWRVDVWETRPALGPDSLPALFAASRVHGEGAGVGRQALARSDG